MRGPKLRTQTTALIAIFALLALFLPTSPATGAWLPTRAAVEGPKARLVSFLEREEVSLELQKMGVDPAEAKRRVAGLTDAEARLALDKLDSLPAAGELGVIIGAVLFVFIVLLITDILGLTRVFPFVKKTVR
jgi:hypothetical protein